MHTTQFTRIFLHFPVPLSSNQTAKVINLPTIIPEFFIFVAQSQTKRFMVLPILIKDFHQFGQRHDLLFIDEFLQCIERIICSASG